MGDVAALGMVRRRDLGPGVLWPPVRARRCLFGPPDPDRTRTLLENETKRIERDNKERWNFDFVEGRPLNDGRYSWTLLTKDASSNAADPDNDPAVEKENNTKADDERSEEPKKSEQSHITDFMRKRKLSSNLKETMTPESKTRRRFST